MCSSMTPKQLRYSKQSRLPIVVSQSVKIWSSIGFKFRLRYTGLPHQQQYSLLDAEVGDFKAVAIVSRRSFGQRMFLE